MALVLADRVKETSTTTGTGSFTLAGASTGYQSFSSAIGNGNTTYYVIENPGLNEWESGLGTFTSPSTLARTTVYSSSNAGSLVTFSAGTKNVFVDMSATKWPAGVLGVANGGTGANLSATGGTSQVLKQTSAGGAITVAQLAASDLSNGTTGTAGTAVVLADSPTFTGTPVAPQFNASNGIYINSQTVSVSYSIPSGSSGMSAGPISIASGQSVTVPSGSRWVVL